MSTVDVVDVDVDSRAAWALLEDVTRNPDWQSGMTTCEWTSPAPVGVGSTYEQRARFLGREIRGEPGGLMGLLAPLVRPRFEASVAADGRRLVALLEGAPVED